VIVDSKCEVQNLGEADNSSGSCDRASAKDQWLGRTTAKCKWGYLEAEELYKLNAQSFAEEVPRACIEALLGPKLFFC
jgi:hypothetical protein